MTPAIYLSQLKYVIRINSSNEARPKYLQKENSIHKTDNVNVSFGGKYFYYKTDNVNVSFGGKYFYYKTDNVNVSFGGKYIYYTIKLCYAEL